MTEIEEAVGLTAAQQKFILHWGEMGARWGINRTVAQVHALLYIWPEPLPAEDVARLLEIARSNVSNSLRELQNWRLARVVHHKGDRRDFFETVHDVWEMFRIILEERRKREIEPTLALLRECVAEVERERSPSPITRSRLRSLLDGFELASAWYTQMRDVPSAVVLQIAKMGTRALRILRPSKT
jgi:DNA-binding transcriptional regulator GbsR (MarR family)